MTIARRRTFDNILAILRSLKVRRALSVLQAGLPFQGEMWYGIFHRLILPQCTVFWNAPVN